MSMGIIALTVRAHCIAFSFSLQDFQAQLYEAYYLNFISAISRQKLEDIASSAIQCNCVSQVSKVNTCYIIVGQSWLSANLGFGSVSVCLSVCLCVVCLS